MIVLSLFDGISGAQLALKRLNITPFKYYSSEIDKYAIQITQKNFPNTIQLGDICNIDTDYFLDCGIKIDLMIWGSPCQDLSIANTRGRKGLSGEKSSLFYEAVRIFKEVKPKYWIMENVNSMKKEDKKVITEMLGVEPIMINSALLTAQNRKRLYWTNIPNITQPEDKGITLKDILSEDGIIYNKYNNSFHYEKSKTVGCYTGSYTAVSGQFVLSGNSLRKLTPIECERLQGFDDDYTSGISNTQRYKCIGNAFTVPVIEFILKKVYN